MKKYLIEKGIPPLPSFARKMDSLKECADKMEDGDSIVLTNQADVSAVLRFLRNRGKIATQQTLKLEIRVWCLPDTSDDTE